MKTCYKCKLSKSFSEFHKRSAASDGLQSSCKDCNNQTVRQWQSENPDKYEAIWKRNSYGDFSLLKRRASRYGLTVEELMDLLEKAGNKCELCGKPPKRWLVVDHCHTKGNVRGLLCEACNQGLGLFYDNPDVLEKAAKYVQQGLQALK